MRCATLPLLLIVALCAGCLPDGRPLAAYLADLDGTAHDTQANADTGSDASNIDTSSQDAADTALADTGPPLKDGCSGPDGPQYVIFIENTSDQFDLQISWNGEDCEENVLGSIKPGKTSKLATNLDRWVVIRIGPDLQIIRQFRVTTTTSTKMLIP